ncbi:MAG: tetratricopeptide repeat protein [Actinobacteria bacterium]|nr:tetratricopeptide repeat protein [Actinomycetota bacterium]
MTETTSTTRPTAASSGGRLGDRLRLLRVAAGLTQTELAGERFSKEYVSQIERGKTRPTVETIEWLAGRLAVDPAFLTSGVSTDERGRVEALLARAEALTQAHRHKEAIAEYEQVRSDVRATNSAPLDVRARSGEAWARMEEGDVRTGVELLIGARSIAESEGFSDLDRAELIFRLGVCRYKLSSIGTAIALFDEALSLAERSQLPCDVLRADVLGWRSRCHRRGRDYEAAREDAERALELARAVGDRSMIANGFFQASLVAERTGHWLLSRNYAEKAKALYQELNDERTVGRLMNNLGGLNLLLGKPQEAIEQLKASFAVAVAVEAQADAAVAMGGLGAVHLQLGDWDEADSHAREALRLLDGREDEFLVEIGQSRIVLGRSLLERARLDEAEECFRAADTSFEQLSSIGHRAGAWVALGDLAARRGDDAEAARRYRNAAEALQENRF